jgi:hypothetical protein
LLLRGETKRNDTRAIQVTLLLSLGRVGNPEAMITFGLPVTRQETAAEIADGVPVKMNH